MGDGMAEKRDGDARCAMGTWDGGSSKKAWFSSQMKTLPLAEKMIKAHYALRSKRCG